MHLANFILVLLQLGGSTGSSDVLTKDALKVIPNQSDKMLLH